MAEITLKDGSLALIDDEDLGLIGGLTIILRKNGYLQVKSQLLHRLIMSAPSGSDVDHINRCKLDNRKSNLRIVSHQENTLNRGHWAISGFKGVYFRHNCQRWRADIRHEGKPKILGYYLTAAAANEARQLFLAGNPRLNR